MPRVGYTPDDGSRQRPHHDTSARGHTILCYCVACDKKVQQELPVRLSELCDCDQYTRWICLSCKLEEDHLDHQYLETRTRLYWEEIDGISWDGTHELAGYLVDHFMLPDPPKDRAVSYLTGVILLIPQSLNKYWSIYLLYAAILTL